MKDYEKDYKEAIKLLKLLMSTCTHEPKCQFASCTCGSALKHSNAQLEVGRFLRKNGIKVIR